MKYFREKTLNKVVVMGSNTLKSFPNGKPLKNRINIVLFPGGEKRDDCIVVDNMDELKLELKKYNTDDVFIIGGASIYRQTLPYVDEVYLTKVNAEGGAEVFFVNIDEDKNFECFDEGTPMLDGDIEIRFTKYRNLNKQKI